MREPRSTSKTAYLFAFVAILVLLVRGNAPHSNSATPFVTDKNKRTEGFWLITISALVLVLVGTPLILVALKDTDSRGLFSVGCGGVLVAIGSCMSALARSDRSEPKASKDATTLGAILSAAGGIFVAAGGFLALSAG